MMLRRMFLRILAVAAISAVGFAPYGEAQLESGDILVVDLSAGTNSSGALFSINPDTGNRTLITDFGLSTQGPLGSNPVGLAVEPSGDILVATFSGLLFRVDPDTGMRLVLSNFSDGSQGPTGASLGGIAIDSGGSVLAMDKSRRLAFRVDPASGQRTIASDFDDTAQGPAGVNPFGVAVHDSGTVLVTDQALNGGQGGLFSVDPATGARTLVSDFANPAQGPLGEEPNGVAVDAAGGVIVADLMAGIGSGFNNVGVLFNVDPVTGNRTSISDFADPAQGPLGYGPVGVAVASSGTILTTLLNQSASVQPGLLVAVEPATGFRTVLSNFGDPSQGPLGRDPFAVAIVPEDLTSVTIVIKPGGEDNVVNPGSRGKVTVAVLSSTGFDAADADWQTVRFAGAPALNIGRFAKDVNRDGVPDGVFHFDMRYVVLAEDATEACLSGTTRSGIEFEGCGAVRRVP